MYILNTQAIDALSLNFGDLWLNFLSTSQEKKKKEKPSFICLSQNIDVILKHANYQIIQ